MPAHFDGRIDNRDDLLTCLGDVSRACSDAGLAQAVFERWGPAGLARIVGEWSFAMWGPAPGELHLARDYMGVRPLYYYAGPYAVEWSADLAELVTRTGRAGRLDDRFAARFMSLSPGPDVTPYDGIQAVPPGVCLSFASSGRRATRTTLWHAGADEIRYRDPRAYEEQLRALWRDAVLARLRSTEPVWAELSGGLDSSSIVCMAALLIAQGVAASPGLRLVSHATLRSPEGDERRFIAEVERQVGVRSEIVGVEDSYQRVDPARGWLSPYALHGVGLETVERVRAGGGRVVLSGRIGDAIMGCQPDNSSAVHDDLRRGRLVTAAANLHAWSRATRKPIVELAAALLIGDRQPAPDTAVALLTPRLRAMLDAPRVEAPAGVRRSKRSLARMILGYSAGARLDIPDRAPGVVYAYPFTHRPLVEFMLAIPGEQLSAPGVTRSLMRRAFESFVPPRVIRRISKGYYPPAVYRSARERVATIRVRDLEVVERGWIDPDRLQAAIDALTTGGGDSGGDVDSVLRLESWLQARRTHPGTPRQKEVNTDEVLHA
jgi:asparagine synthase (glutamine-hydrolysing)